MPGKEEQAHAPRWEQDAGIGRNARVTTGLKGKTGSEGNKATSGGACRPHEKLFFITGNKDKSLNSDHHQMLHLGFPEGPYEDTLNLKAERMTLEME